MRAIESLRKSIEDFLLPPEEKYSAERLKLDESSPALSSAQAAHSFEDAVIYGAFSAPHLVGALPPMMIFCIMAENWGLPQLEDPGTRDIALYSLGTMASYGLFGAAYLAFRARSLFRFSKECEENNRWQSS